MKRNWIWFLLFLVLGVSAGFFLSARFNQPAVPKGTALLREFSFTAIASQVGQTNWQVLEDRTYEPFPALARCKRIARRIVARVDIPDAEFDRFVTQFQQTITAALGARNARNTAQFELVQDSTRLMEGRSIRSRLDLPRRYYAIGNIHGVADIGYVAEMGRVTVMVSLIEGP